MVPKVLRSRGAGRDRTAEWRFCRPLPYHLATAPGDWKAGAATRLLQRLNAASRPDAPRRTHRRRAAGTRNTPGRSRAAARATTLRGDRDTTCPAAAPA